MARTIGRKNRNLVKQLVIEELEKTRGKPWLPTPSRQTIEKIVIEKLPVELWDTWEGADSEIRMIIWDTVSEGHVGSAMKEVAGEADSKRDILKRCLRRAGYSGLLSEHAHEKSTGDLKRGNPHKEKKYTVEVKLWTKQMRPGGGPGEYEMPLEEARALVERIVGSGIRRDDIDIREVIN